VWHQKTGTASLKTAIEEIERGVTGIEVRGWKSDASCRVTLVPRQSVLSNERGSPDYQGIRITERNSVIQAKYKKINTQGKSKFLTVVVVVVVVVIIIIIIIIMGLLSLSFHCNKEIREQESYDTREITALLLSS